jgi:hypothetical protein
MCRTEGQDLPPTKNSLNFLVGNYVPEHPPDVTAAMPFLDLHVHA